MDIECLDKNDNEHTQVPERLAKVADTNLPGNECRAYCEKVLVDAHTTCCAVHDALPPCNTAVRDLVYEPPLTF
jgi:hypothetical protein